MRLSKFLMLFFLVLYTRSVLSASGHKIHDMLDLEKNCPEAAVSSAYKKAALFIHPDKTDDPEKLEYFKEMTEAYNDFKINGENGENGKLRVKRDGGISATTYAVVAITAGLVNVTAEQLVADHQFTLVEATVGMCYWEGKAPFCMATSCPPGYDEIRRSKGWQHVGEGFGGRCVTPFGDKIQCCRASIGDNSWGGSWQHAASGIIYHCSYWPLGRCGQLDCNHGVFRFIMHIDGEDGKCNEVHVPVVGWSAPKIGIWAAGVIQFPRHYLWGVKDRLYKIH